MSSQVIKLSQQIKKVRIPGEIEIQENITPAFKEPPESSTNSEPQPKPKPEFIEITEQHLNNQLKEAYQEGFDCGCQEQELKHLQEYQHRFGLLDQISAACQNEKQRCLEFSEEIIIKLAMAIAQKILAREVTMNQEGVKKVVRQALKKVSNMDKIVTVLVNPADKEILAADISNLAEEFIHLKEIQFQADDRIKPGGCLIESNSSTIDATLETQLREIEQCLFKELEND